MLRDGKGRKQEVGVGIFWGSSCSLHRFLLRRASVRRLYSIRACSWGNGEPFLRTIRVKGTTDVEGWREGGSHAPEAAQLIQGRPGTRTQPLSVSWGTAGPAGLPRGA